MVGSELVLVLVGGSSRSLLGEAQVLPKGERGRINSGLELPARATPNEKS